MPQRKFLSRSCRASMPGLVCLIVLAAALFQGQPASAQKMVPPGFKCELIYAVPDIEVPCVLACDDEGSLYVGEDPMDMTGPPTKEIDRIIKIRWDKATGKPIKTAFADHLSAVFGLVWHDGALYVMHAPHYTMLRDTKGTGVADLRKDLAEGFGAPAGVYGFNDHIISSIHLGMDGLVYVSCGDKGIPKATGADGSTLTLEGGGVVRMRLDGTQLEHFSSGTRNHLGLALDWLDNIFTYDNTDDGLGWWTRYTHHIETGYYGYPYDYHPHPERHLPRIAEYGGGSPVGAACYLEAAWPEKYRGNAFHCEWGKGKVQRFAFKKHGASFDVEVEDFMVSDGSDFRPLDICVSPDGKAMYVADWNLGAWLQPKHVGRLYRITYVGGDVPPEPPLATDSDPIEAQIKSLGHPAHSERMRAQWRLSAIGKPAIGAVSKALRAADNSPRTKVHAIWVENQWFDSIVGYDPTADWLAALADADVDVRGQAARALGLRKMKGAVKPLIAALADRSAGVRMRAAIALGRIDDASAVQPLCDALGETDIYARFAVIQALRRLNKWDVVGVCLHSTNKSVRDAALIAATGIYEKEAVQGVVTAIADTNSNDEDYVVKLIQALAEVGRKADPYTGGWWGTQPAAGKPARSKTHDWEGTDLVEKHLVQYARYADSSRVRIAGIAALIEIKGPFLAGRLRDMLTAEKSDDVRAEIVKGIATLREEASLPELLAIVGDESRSESLRRSAIDAIAAINSQQAVGRLAEIVASDKTSSSLVVMGLETLGGMKAASAVKAVEHRLDSPRPNERAKAIAAYAAIRGPNGQATIAKKLADSDVGVRQAALAALAGLHASDAVPAMVAAAADPSVRFEAIQALAAMPDRRALPLYLDGLVDKNQGLREACRTALIMIRESIAADVIELQKRHELAQPVRLALQDVFSSPGPVTEWQFLGSWNKSADVHFDTSRRPETRQPVVVEGRQLKWQRLKTDDVHGRITLQSTFSPNSNCWGIGYAAIEVAEPGRTQLTIGSDDQATVWVNGAKVYDFDGNRGWNWENARIDVDLKGGVNHIWFQIGNEGGPWEFSLNTSRRDPRFRFLYENVPAKLDLAAYRDFALKTPGNSENGRRLFADLKGAACIKCHSVAGAGGKVGPDLAGIAAKYPREELIRSVLEPSNRIADGYQMTVVTLTSGKIVQGLVKSDTDQEIELADIDAKINRIRKADIDDRTRSNLSLMPSGLNEGMTLSDFADVIGYLSSLKK